MIRPVVQLAFLFTMLFALSSRAETPLDGPQSQFDSGTSAAQKYPRIVLYSVSWCPHCREAKEYLTSHNIPFINRDVELDDSARDELIDKYKSGGVPLIVFGNDEKVMKGFNREGFEKILKDMSK
jgi:glutaredoxin-like YruB-family protein